MKKIVKIFILLAIISVLAINESNAQSIYVHARLGRPARWAGYHPNRPSPRHVWVSEEWTPNGSSYSYQHGYWAIPPAGHGAWIAGHWAKRPHRPGYFWAPGHWA